MHRLGVRLALAFLAVIVVSVGGVALLVTRETTNEFQSYVERGRYVYVERVMTALQDYYRRRGGWSGVEPLLGSLVRSQHDHLLVADADGLVVADNTGQALGQPAASLGLGPGVPLLDDERRVGTLYAALSLSPFWRGPRSVIVVEGNESGPLLRAVEPREVPALSAEREPRAVRPGRPSWDGSEPQAPGAAEGGAGDRTEPRARRGPPPGPRVELPMPGTLLARPQPSSTTPEAGFVERMGRAVLLSALAAGVVGALLSLLLARQLAQPLAELAASARALAGGNLRQRVRVRRGDEVGALAVAFNDMAASLEQAETARRDLVADVAHELRTPLTVIEGTVDAMLDGVYPADRERLESIRDETRLLAKLVADLRELSLADVGRLVLDRQPLDPAVLVRRALAGAAARAEARGVTLSAEVADELPLVLADEQRIVQVLANLLDNALRYTAAGGTVTVSAALETRFGCAPPAASQVPPAPVPSGIAPPQRGIRFTVRDTGAGIDADDLPHIFDRFYKADASRARRGSGSGLGLAIARGYIDAHGGHIWAESTPGEGTTVGFWLPAATEGSVAATPAAGVPVLARA